MWEWEFLRRGRGPNCYNYTYNNSKTLHLLQATAIYRNSDIGHVALLNSYIVYLKESNSQQNA